MYVQNGSQHLEPFLGEGFWSDCRVLLFHEPVKIFHQFFFLFLIQVKDVSVWKLFRIVFHGFINVTRLYAVQFGDITVEDDLLVSQGDDPTKTTNGQKCAFFAYARFWQDRK